MYHHGHYINVVLLDKSCGVPGSVCLNEDDSYTVFIDAGLSAEKQKEVFEHEIRHITRNDFDKTNVQEIEVVAHNV